MVYLFVHCVYNVIWFQSTDIEDNDFVLRDHMEEINRLFEGESVEEIFANLEKDGSEWALKQLNTLKKMVTWLTPIECMENFNLANINRMHGTL